MLSRSTSSAASRSVITLALASTIMSPLPTLRKVVEPLSKGTVARVGVVVLGNSGPVGGEALVVLATQKCGRGRTGDPHHVVARDARNRVWDDPAHVEFAARTSISDTLPPLQAHGMASARRSTGYHIAPNSICALTTTPMVLISSPMPPNASA